MPPTPASLAASGSEAGEQTALFCWAAMQFNHCSELQFLFAIPNGGMRNPIVAAQLKAQGVKRGVPDIMLPIIQQIEGVWYAGLWIELKKLKGGKTKDADQLRWAGHLIGQGYRHQLCIGYLAGIDAIKAYMGSNRPWRDTV
jgi:hypothetical protein